MPVHTELGHRCRAPRWTAAWCLPDTPLATASGWKSHRQGRRPSRDWLNPTRRAQERPGQGQGVRQWFKQQDMDTHIQEGRALLDKEIHRLNLTNVNLRSWTRLKFSKQEELFAALGRGRQRHPTGPHPAGRVRAPRRNPGLGFQTQDRGCRRAG